jgi:phage-related minor tail protein
VRAVLDQLDGDLAAAKKKTEGVMGGIASNVKKLGGLALAGIGAGVVAIAGGAVVAIKALSGMVEEAMASQEVQAALNAVLTSTGGIAGVTADKANDLADALSKVTRFDDEAILSGESLLLTFTNIGKNVFPQTTQTMLDMSTVLGQDLPSSARMLGRALNDPISGMSALTRVGITFTDEQKKTIKSLVEAGELEKAQGIILDALAVKFGGAAAAAGQTFAGQMDILKNRLGNVREEIGGALLPVAGQLMDWFGQAVDQALPILIPLFEQLTTVITNVVMAIDPLVQGIIAAMGGDTTALVTGFY